MGKPAVFRDHLIDRASNILVDAKTEPHALFAKKKKKPDTRLWMRLRSEGDFELLELDRNTLTKMVSIPPRDLRILGPVFSQSSSILARETAMVVNLEFIKAIVTAQEVLVLDPTSAMVEPFVGQLKEQLCTSKKYGENKASQKEAVQWNVTDVQEPLLGTDFVGSTQDELPFEFRVLEVALEVVCGFLDSKTKELEGNAYPILDELTRNVSTSNLEHVRILKSELTRLLARVQKVRDEMEHLLDDDDDMADLYLTRKNLLSQLEDAATIASSADSRRVSQFSSRRFTNVSLVGTLEDRKVEQLEMLLEAYFVQVDGTRKKILAVREYIDDTEDYVNIQLDSQRNELIQLHISLGMVALSVSVISGFSGALSINIPIPWYEINGLFVPFTISVVAMSILLFFLIFGYARWKGHFTS